MIHIKKLREGDIYTIVLIGDVDASSSIEVDNAVAEGVKDGVKKILVDCSSLEYISSAGLGVFMSYIEDFRNTGTTMILFGMNDKVANTFGILGLDQLLTIAENKQKALEHLK